MRFVRFSIGVATVLICSSHIALAQNIVGKWTGKLDINMSSLPKAQTAQQQEKLNQMVAIMKSLRFAMTINKDKTFTIIVPAGGPNKTMKKAEGTWTQTGTTGILHIVREGGQAHKEDLPMVISKDGKTISAAPKDAASKGKMVFVRG